MSAPMTYTDDDRRRLATADGQRMVGPKELGRCDHNRLYSYRWTWPVDGDVEDGEPEFLSHGCRRCRPEGA